VEQAPSLQIIRQVADNLAKRYLGTYTEALAKGHAASLRRKEINDPLWGTISLSPIEVAVLDSPLLQRLRFLRQMGAAHWVYPGAVHTRFEHALGALHLTDRLIKTINALAREGASEDAPLLIKDAEAQILRIASLFSHVGNLCFSDCSSAELELRPEFATLAKDFSNDPTQVVPGDDPSISQVLSYYIVRAPATKDFFATVIRECKPLVRLPNHNEASTVEETVRQVSLAVIGRRLEDKRLQLHELICGPFDGHALDQLVRDAQFAGIPSVLDIRRLLQKLSVSKCLAKTLPTHLAETLSVDENDEVHLFGVRPSATSVLNELQLASVLIATKISHHPKVLAVEQMLRSVIRAIGELVPPESLLEFLYTHAEDAFVALQDKSLIGELGLTPEGLATTGQREKVNAAAATLSAVRERRLWVRALQLSLPPVSPDESDKVHLEKLTEFVAKLGHVQLGGQLLDELHKETLVVLDANNSSKYTAVEVRAQVNARVLKASAGETRVGRALILREGRDPHSLSDSWGSHGNWVHQYMAGQPDAYLFCPEDLANPAFIATERVMSKYGATLPVGCVEASKRDAKALNAYKRAMAREAWSGFSYDIRPGPSRLARMSETIRKLELTLAKVSPEVGAGGSDKTPNLQQVIYNWLHQFETDEHLDCAIKLIEGLSILTRQETMDALQAFFATHSEFKGATFIPFGNVKDGSVLQGYFAEGEKGKGSVGKVSTLEEWARAGDGSPVVFMDDFTGSGSQAKDILAAGFRREDLRKRELKETRDAWPQQHCEQLLSTPVAFLFVAAWDDGLTVIKEVAREIGLQATVFAHRQGNQIPYARAFLTSAGIKPAQVDAFLERCRSIGEELVRNEPRETPRTEEEAKELALGYGNRGMLLSTLFNVPTQTLTLIWMSGKVDGGRWNALLPRRKKS
jgi:HD superfamily phosphohydrolase